MYNIDQNTQSEAAGFTGIQDNFELVAVRYGVVGKKEGSAAKGLMFDFKRGEKFTITHTEFPIDVERQKQYRKKIKVEGVEREETAEEAVERAFKEQATRIKHIVSKFIAEDKIIIKASSFEEYANAVIKLLGDTFKGIKLRLKLIYNNKNLLSFPKFPKFVELMSVTPTQLELTDYDKDKLKKSTADAETGGSSKGAATPDEDFV
jgi:hypothetical protein